VLTGEGGPTVVEGRKLTFAEGKTVSGSGALVVRNTVTFNGALTGSPSLVVEDAGKIRFVEGSSVAGYPTIDLPADSALQIVDGMTVTSVRVTVGGEPLPEGTYAGRFGAGTLVVSTAQPADSAWTGAAGDLKYFTDNNWRSRTPPEGAGAHADFGSAVFTEPTTILVNDNLTILKLTAPNRAADLTLKIADDRDALSLVYGGEIVAPAAHTLTIEGHVVLPESTSPVKKVSVTGGGKLVLKGTVANASSTTDFTQYAPRMIARGGSEIELACKSAGGVQFYTASANQYEQMLSKVTVAEGADIVLCDIPSWYSISGDASVRGAFTVNGGRVAFTTGAYYWGNLMGGVGDGISGSPTSVVTLNGGEFITPQGVRCLATGARKLNKLVLNGGTWRQTVGGEMGDPYVNIELADATLDVAEDVAFEADLGGEGGRLAKTGSGALTILRTATGMKTLDIQSGTGTLSAMTASSLSRGLAIHIPSITAALNLDYTGLVTIREMWIGGQQRGRGRYSATGSTHEEFNHFFTGPGELQVLSGDYLGVILIVR